jgi:hypothetical protein
VSREQDLERVRDALDNLEAAIKKELGPVLYFLSRVLRWLNKGLARLHGK